MKSLGKLTFREIFKSFSRFIAILLIVALGTGFFAGLLSVAPDMRDSIDAYYKTSRFMDLRVLSTFGFNAEDVAAVRQMDGVSGVYAAYSVDTAVTLSEKRYSARIESIPDDLSDSNPDYINRLALVSGRMPENENECVVEYHGVTAAGPSEGDLSVIGKETYFGSSEKTFTIVGAVSSPRYFSIEDEYTDAGDGRLTLFVYVKESAFTADLKTDLFIRIKSAEDEKPSSEGYNAAVAAFEDAVKTVSAVRIEARYDEYKNDLSEKISAGEKELSEKKAAAEKQYAAAEAEFKKQVDSLDALSKSLKSERNAFNSKLNNYNGRVKTASTNYNNALSDKNAALAATAKKLAALDQSDPEYSEKYDELMAESNAITAEIEALNASRADELDDFKTEKNKLDSEDRALTKKENGYLSSVGELNDSYNVYLLERAKADREFEKAEAELDSARALLEGASAPKWYLFGRDKSVSAKSFESVVKKTEAIAFVFPIFFFFIAAFVALTAMTRLVDARRGQIGVLKALGYSNGAIMAKYIVYAATATLLGSAAGLAVGFTVLPRVVWNAYSIMFTLPDLATPFNVLRAVIVFSAMLLCTVGATFIACKKVISEEPSRLFLPKAPAPGKRVLLEHVGFIWKHMGFLKKVTVRNLFRYKKRFILTIAGVAGCTALLLTGFGLKDSISVIADRQFKTVYRYNLTVGLEERSDGFESSFAKAANILAEHGYYAFIRAGALNVDVVKEGVETVTATVTVAENYNDLHYFITLRNRESREPVAFGEDSVVICEKLAERFGVKEGSVLKVKDEDGKEYELTVTGITENYVSNVIYTTREVSEKVFGSSPALSTVMAMAKGEEEDRSALASELLESGYVVSAVYFDEIAESLKESMKSINSVVYVLIISAAVLSFVVLYNLIDINITERKREIATLKVLGYRGGEAFAYVSREIMVLTIIGTALGLLLGFFLHAFVVRTAEVDAVMFARTINNSSYALAAMFSLVFAFLVNLLMYPKISKIDTVLSLKAGE